MKIILSLLLLALSANCLAATEMDNKPIELKNPKDIQDAKRFGQKLEALNEKSRGCRCQGLAKDDECYCFYPKELFETKTALAEVLTLHPDWRGQAVIIRNIEKPGDFQYLSFSKLNQGLAKTSTLSCPTHPSSGTR